MNDLQITGTDSLIKRLQKGVTTSDVKMAILRNGAEMQETAQRFAPVAKVAGGTLKRSIELEIRSGGYTASVMPHTKYATYQEYGTRFMTGTPYMRPAFYQQKIIFLSDMAKLLK